MRLLLGRRNEGPIFYTHFAQRLGWQPCFMGFWLFEQLAEEL